jgi:hypothetical protein
MADLKISQLTALTAIDVYSTDVLPIVDTSATTTKKVSAADVAEYVSASSAVSDAILAKSQDDQFVLAAAIFTS